MEEGGARPSAPVESLLAQVEWVRRLARVLVADAHDAADVEQETWRLALARPPASASHPRRWLATVARNVARKLVRREQTRRRHEAELAQVVIGTGGSGHHDASSTRAAAEITARAELHRRVVDVVLSLDELHRVPLLLRFFDDLDASEVAARLNVPIETARTRIKRALALVRTRLVAATGEGDERQGLARALAPLLGSPIAPITAGVGTVTTGVTVMATTWKLAAAALLVATVAWLGLRLRRVTAAPRNDLTSSVEPSPASSVASVPADVGPRRVAVEPTRATSAGLLSLLRGFVVDSTGALVSSAAIEWNVTPKSRDRVATVDGEYAIAGLSKCTTRFHVTAPGFQPLDTSLDLSAGGMERHDFALARSALVPFRVVGQDGTSVLVGEKGTREFQVFTSGLAVVATDEPLQPLLPPSWYANLQHLGIGKTSWSDPRRGRFVPGIPEGMDGVVDVPHLPVDLALLMKNVVLQHHHVASTDDTVTFTVDLATIARSMGRVVGRVVDARSGAPLEGVHVASGDLSHSGGGSATRSDGRFDLGPMASGFVKLDTDCWTSAPVGTVEGYHRWLTVDPGKTTDVGDLRLARGIAWKSKVLDANGRPTKAEFALLRQDLIVPGVPIDTNYVYVTETPGELAIPDLGPHRYTLVADASHGNESIAVAGIDGSDGAPPTTVVQFAKPVAVTFVCDVKPERTLSAQFSLLPAGIFRSHGFSSPDVEKLGPGRHRLALFEQTRLVREVEFDVGSDPLRVEFSLDDSGLPRVTTAPPDSPIERESKPAIATMPVAVALDRKPSLVVVGRVVDSTGAPLPNVDLSTLVTCGPKPTTTTHSNGCFAVSGLRPGRVDLVARCGGWRESAESIELVDGDGPRQVDLTLERTTRVKVRLVDPSGAPLATSMAKKFSGGRNDESLSVVATRDEPKREIARDGLDSFGHWERAHDFDGSEDGTLEVDEELPVFASVVFGTRVLATERLDAPKDELTITVDPQRLDPLAASLRFRLVDAVTREPILCAGAVVNSPESWGWPGTKQLPPESDGVWTFDRLPPGPRNLCISADGLPSGLTLRIDLVAGQRNDLGDLAIARNLEIHGRVVDESGKPVRTKISASPVGSDGDWAGGVDHLVESDADGRFIVPVSSPKLRLSSNQGELGDSRIVDVARLGAAEVVLTLHRGTVVTLRPRHGARGARRVSIFQANGDQVTCYSTRGAAPQQRQLAPGSYLVLVEHDGSDPREQTIVVGDAPVDVDLGD